MINYNKKTKNKSKKHTLNFSMFSTFVYVINCNEKTNNNKFKKHTLYLSRICTFSTCFSFLSPFVFAIYLNSNLQNNTQIGLEVKNKTKTNSQIIRSINIYKISNESKRAA